MSKQCCDRKDVTCFKLLSQSDIEQAREAFYTLSSETQQTQYVLDYMRQHVRGDKYILYTIAGREVCETCFRMVYGIRYGRFYVMKTKFFRGILLNEHGRLGTSKVRESTIRVVSWLRMFASKVGDRMPTCDDIHLPSCLTKADVYAIAEDDLTQGGMKSCGMSTFYTIWRQEFPNVKIPKVV